MKQKEQFIIRDFENYTSITALLKQQHFSFENRVLEQKIIEANYHISKQLNIPLASKVFFLKRLRIVEGIPSSIEKIYVAAQEMEGLETFDFNQQSFYEVVLSKKGIKKLRHHEEILIVQATQEERDLLLLPSEQTEIQLIKGISVKEDETVFEYFEISSLASFYRYRSVSYLWVSQ